MKLELSEENKGRIILQLLTAVFGGYSLVQGFVSAFGFRWDLGSCFSGNLADGLRSLYNGAADGLGRSCYLLLPQLTVENTKYGLALSLLFLMLSLLVLFMLRARMRLLAAVFYLGLPLALAACGLQSSLISEGLLLGAFLLFFSVSEKGSAGVRLLSAAGVSAVLILLLLAGGTSVELTPPASFQTAAAKLQTAACDRLYHADDLSRGRLGSLTTRERGGKTALRVQMEKPQAMYLRGFVGADFDGRTWTQVSNARAYGQYETYRSLHQEGFSPLTQLAEAAALCGRENVQEVTIENTAADRGFAYLPYELAELPEIAGTVNKDDSMFAAGSFACMGTPGGSFGGIEKTSLSVAESQTGRWTDAVSQLYVRAAKGGKKGREIQRQFVVESHYNAMAYRDYTALSAGTEKLFKAKVGSAGERTGGHVAYKAAINSVKKYMRSHFTYSENFTPPKADEDFLTHFFASKKGCDVHYAATATLLFRYYGIPARYVSGYLLTPEDVKTAKDGEIAVPQKNFHAWTEIYVDGYGWVPIETCPAYEDVMPQADLSKGLRTLQVKQPETQQQEEKDGKQDVGETQKAVRLLRLVLLVLAGLIALLFAAWIFRRLLRMLRRRLRRRRAFYSPDAKAAVCALYADCLRSGIPLSRPMQELGERAAYSLHAVSAAEAEWMRKERRRAYHEYKKEKH